MQTTERDRFGRKPDLAFLDRIPGLKEMHEASQRAIADTEASRKAHPMTEEKKQ